jgi:haloacetate dehalogenase
MTSWSDFESDLIDCGGVRIFARWHGSGPAVLLLHGFPETHLMWRDVAPLLARRFTVVCADLRGYGASDCASSSSDHAPYAKRAMAGDMVRLMERLGFERFCVAGHDRGGRVAYRLALDHPARIEKLAVLDVVPTVVAWELAGAEFALAFWPWSLLAQPPPLPERLLAASADDIVDHALDSWGSAVPMPPEVRMAYAAALRDPAHAHAVCEEYRAAAGLDRVHDAESRTQGKRIECPVHVSWSAGGGIDAWYASRGGPLGIWREWGRDVAGGAVAGGHFFPEERPAETAGVLEQFFGGGHVSP